MDIVKVDVKVVKEAVGRLKIVNKLIARFDAEKKGLDILFRKTLGLRPWAELTQQEKLAEIIDYIKKDIAISLEEAKGKDPIEYLIDRVLDPLDPMNVFYGAMLEFLGVEVIPGKSVKLPMVMRRKVK